MLYNCSIIHPLYHCLSAWVPVCVCVCVCVFVCVILVYGEDLHKEEKWIFLITLKGASYRDVELFWINSCK